jgi:chromosome segregation ATPase
MEDNAQQKQRMAVERALANTVPLHEHAATREALEHAEQRATHLREANGALSEEVEALSCKLSKAQSDARSAQEGKEVSDATVTGLETILQKIEKQIGRGGKAPRSQEDVQLATLSRQIVNAKLAEADAQRRVKLAARQELEHRQKIAAQADRIEALKEALAEARKEAAHLRSQVPHAAKAARGRPAGEPSRHDDSDVRCLYWAAKHL